MTTSEFAHYIFSKFPQATGKDEYRTWFSVIKRGGHQIVGAYEPASGMTKVYIEGRPYSKMTAAEKREALEFINNLEFDMVVDHDVFRNYTETFNYECGSFTEGEEITIAGGNEIWRRIEKVTRVK